MGDEILLSDSLKGVLDYNSLYDTHTNKALSLKIWNDNINPKKDGQFSTLIIAGGGGWESDGIYTLKAEQGDLENETEFKFVV